MRNLCTGEAAQNKIEGYPFTLVPGSLGVSSDATKLPSFIHREHQGEITVKICPIDLTFLSLNLQN